MAVTQIARFELLQLLGRGSFGRTYLGIHTETYNVVAVKTILKETLQRAGWVHHVYTENRILNKLDHPFIVRAICSVQLQNMFCFVTEFLSGGELLFYTKEKPFSEEQATFYSAQILLAIKYLHSLNIVYRDLKVENIMLDNHGHVKLIDFGLCFEEFEESSQLYAIVGTPMFQAPEVIRREGYGYGVDWWGLGVVTYELMVGFPPFDHDDAHVVQEHILNSEACYPEDMSATARSLLEGLLQKDQLQRLGGGHRGVAELMDHPFYGSIRWRDLEELKVCPPYVPSVSSAMDTRYFEEDCTREKVDLGPLDCRQMYYPDFEEWERS